MTVLVLRHQPNGDDVEALRPLTISCPPEVVNLVQTCHSHPSQWEGWTTNGQRIYVRFRHGRLWIGLAPEYRPHAVAMLFVARYVGDHCDDGYLSYETLQHLTAGLIDWP
jgi:hypothetical protein